MASLSPKAVLTKARDLGKYSQSSGDGDARPQEMGRNINIQEIEIPRECGQCCKHIKKGKILLVCPCKLFIYCNKECQSSSKHICQKTEKKIFPTFPDQRTNMIYYSCYAHYEYNRKTGQGPSSDRIEKLVKRIQGDPEDMLVLAEAGDPVAAYIVGSAFAERKTQGEGFVMPQKYREKSVVETTEVALKWLTIAAEGGIPEAMYHLGTEILQATTLKVDRRLGADWLVKAHATGKMEYLKQVLETGACRLAGEFQCFSETAVAKENGTFFISGPTLAHLLMAMRWKEIGEWGGKTGLGDTFYGWAYFNEFMGTVGELIEVDDGVWSEKKSVTISFIAGRPGATDISRKVVFKERDENNTKFVQGVKAEFNPDYQLLIQALDKNGHASHIGGGTPYRISCKHDDLDNAMGGTDEIRSTPGGLAIEKGKQFISLDNFKLAGECKPCTEDALQRLHSVAKGFYSISCTEIIPGYAFGARYVNDDGFIVEDIFKAYSKSDIKQVLQCLMTNPADLHPLSVAEDQNLYWPIIWYWGSVFSAVQDTCSPSTLEAIYQKLGHRIILERSASTDASALAAFPESAAGDWRIACGSGECPRVDHVVKFNMCKGCKVKRYCDEDCQRKDWPKHKKFCKFGKNVS